MFPSVPKEHALKWGEELWAMCREDLALFRTVLTELNSGNCGLWDVREWDGVGGLHGVKFK